MLSVLPMPLPEGPRPKPGAEVVPGAEVEVVVVVGEEVGFVPVGDVDGLVDGLVPALLQNETNKYQPQIKVKSNNMRTKE